MKEEVEYNTLPEKADDRLAKVATSVVFLILLSILVFAALYLYEEMTL